MEEYNNTAISSLIQLKYWINIDIRDEVESQKYSDLIDNDVTILKNGDNPSLTLNKYADIRNKLSKLGQLQTDITRSNISQEWKNTLTVIKAASKFKKLINLKK